MPPDSTENPRGPQGKLTPQERLAIARRVEAGERQSDLAREFGVSRQAVSLLVNKFRKEGAEAIMAPRRGRRPSRSLTPDEEELLHQIILEKVTPEAAGLNLVAAGKNVWDRESLRQLVVRECSFTPTTAAVGDLLAKWGLAGKGGREFSQDYYDYINSPIGKEVSRKNWEMRARQEAERAETEQGQGQGEEEELARIRRRMLAGTTSAGGAGQRSGKYRKACGNQTPKRKKRKKGRKR